MSETSGRAPRQAQASITTMTEYVLPTHANALGNVFGGQILAWVDVCAAICAQRHTGRMAITAAIDELSFEKPIRVGQVVHLCAQVTAAFHTSLEILVEVSGEQATTGHKWPCCTAYVTYVALDENLVPTAVPPLDLVTDEQRALSHDAHERRAHRLAKRNRRA
jgi:acyl-CoA hydrolase